MRLKLYIILLCSCLLVSATGCKKYLDEKSDKALGTPSSLDDLQELLDFTNLNLGMNVSNTGADEYYVLYADWLPRADVDKNAYIWDQQTDDIRDWKTVYETVLYANTVLDNLPLISSAGQEQRADNLKGSALFFRAYAFYNATQIFAPVYNGATASTDLGIVLRLNSSVTPTSTRSSVQQSYDQIIADLQESINFLPVTSLVKTRPVKAAAYGLLARVYLFMGNYSKAEEMATACLQLYNTLLDFNKSSDVVITATTPFPLFNKEVIFHSSIDAGLAANSRAKVDTNLFKSYDVNDLRKTAYFRLNTDNVSYRFKGSYSFSAANLFCGIATDEIYLIRAECYASNGKITEALIDLDALRIKRWRTGFFVPSSAATAADALALVLAERKKELVCRGLRWSDLRRLNKESAYAVTLKRVLNGTTYTLAPNDLRYTYLIPRDVLFSVSLPQNPR